jgi:4-hydroxy-2-oxoheptanedioate aldolase
MPHAALTARWDQNLPAWGAWLVEDSPASIETYAQAGFHYVGIDCQHSLLAEIDAARMLWRFRDAPFAIMVRVSGNDHALIGKLLDAGSDGVIVPGVNNVAETKRAVDACRYPPHGQRSLGPIRPGLGVNPEALEARALCLVMIETKDGLENVEEICQVPGLSGIYIGPGDLSHGLGMDPGKGFSTNQLEEAYGRISKACKANGLVLGSHSIDAKFSHQCVAWGCQFVTTGSNQMLLGRASRELMAELSAK